MTEEVAYAELSFQRSSKQENIPKCNTVEDKDIPLLSSRWRFRALVLLTLCLLLLISLLVLGIMFMQVSMNFEKQYGDLQLTWEEGKTNSSRRMLNLKSNLCLKGEEENTNNDLKCALCATNWHLIGGTCYYISRGLKSWQESKKFCDTRNSTLLILNEENKQLVKETLPIERYLYYWIGIHKDKSGPWSWVNGTPVVTTSEWFEARSYEGKEACAHLYYKETVYGTADCNHPYQWICEKAASELT